MHCRMLLMDNVQDNLSDTTRGLVTRPKRVLQLLESSVKYVSNLEQLKSTLTDAQIMYMHSTYVLVPQYMTITMMAQHACTYVHWHNIYTDNNYYYTCTYTHILMHVYTCMHVPFQHCCVSHRALELAHAPTSTMCLIYILCLMYCKSFLTS